MSAFIQLSSTNKWSGKKKLSAWIKKLEDHIFPINSITGAITYPGQSTSRNAYSTSPLASHTSSRIPTCLSSMVWWTKSESCQKTRWIDEKEWTDLGSSMCSYSRQSKDSLKLKWNTACIHNYAWGKLSGCPPGISVWEFPFGSPRFICPFYKIMQQKSTRPITQRSSLNPHPCLEVQGSKTDCTIWVSHTSQS